jgi:hypothetical protein
MYIRCFWNCICPSYSGDWFVIILTDLLLPSYVASSSYGWVRTRDLLNTMLVR